MTSLTTNQKIVQDLYGTHLGRQADTSGMAYWVDQLENKGKTVKDLISGIQSGSEYTKREDYLKANPNATEAELDATITPGGGTYYKDGKLTGVRFDPDNTWSSPLMTSGNNTFTDELAAINEELGITGMGTFSDTVEGMDTAAAANTGNYQVGVTHDAVGNPLTISNNTNTAATNTNTNTAATNTNNTGFLTANDLTSWWEGLDKPWLTQTEDTTADTSGSDDFMKFMMFMSMMRPQGGGYGGGQYGYGGLNPGGVQSAYNPLTDFSNYMDAFKTLPGLSTSTISTGSN